MKNLVILQARMSSTRFPGKVMAEVNGKPMIFWQIQRILRSKRIHRLILATSTDRSDDIIYTFANSLGIEVIRGPLFDVFERYRLVLESYPSDYFVRLTADCPLFMPNLLDSMILEYERNPIDYYSNTLKLSYPDGLDIEIVNTKTFMQVDQQSLTNSEKEHVTQFLYRPNSGFKTGNYLSESNLKDLRWTVDTPEDFNFIGLVFSHFKGRESDFTLEEMLDAANTTPRLQRFEERKSSL